MRQGDDSVHLYKVSALELLTKNNSSLSIRLFYRSTIQSRKRLFISYETSWPDIGVSHAGGQMGVSISSLSDFLCIFEVAIHIFQLWFSCFDLTQRDIAISFRIGHALTYPPTYGIRTKRRRRISPWPGDKTCFKRVVKLCFLTCKTYRNHSYETIWLL